MTDTANLTAIAPTVLGYMGIVVEDILGRARTAHRTIVTTPELRKQAASCAVTTKDGELPGTFVKAFLAKDYDDALVLALLMLERLPGYTSQGFLLHAKTLDSQNAQLTARWLSDEFNPEQAQQAILEDMEIIEAELQRQARHNAPVMFGIGKNGVVAL